MLWVTVEPPGLASLKIKKPTNRVDNKRTMIASMM